MQLLNIIDLTKKYWIFILSVCIVTSVVAALIAQSFIKNVYETSCIMIISNKASSGTGGTINYNDYNLNVNLVNSYRVLCKSNRIIQKVLEKTKLPFTVAELASKISVDSENNTEIIKITAQDTNATTAQTIANSVAEAFEKEIPVIMKVDNIQIVDPARVPTQPSSPNRKAIVMLSLFAGMTFCAVVIALREYLDITVKLEEQLEALAQCPVLVSVPHIRTKN